MIDFSNLRLPFVRTRRRIGAQLLLAAVSAAALAATLAAAPAGAEQLNVAVAANFFGTLQKLAPKYQQASGNELVLSSGSSGQFYTQIRQGAPFDVLLSADTERPKQLEAEGLALPAAASPTPPAHWCCGARRPMQWTMMARYCAAAATG